MLELGRRLVAERAPRGGQVAAEQVIEQRLLGGLERLAEPPEPVGALGRQQVLEGVVEARAGDALSDGTLVAVARAAEEIPGAVLDRVADPDVEVRVDPAARVQARKLRARGVGGEVATDG